MIIADRQNDFAEHITLVETSNNSHQVNTNGCVTVQDRTLYRSSTPPSWKL